jgi:hypothetical protein
MCEKHISEPGNARKCFARSSAHAGSTRSRPAPTSSPASARNRSIQCQPSRRCWRTAGLPSTLPLSQDCRKLGHGFVQSAGYVLASCFCERCPRTKKTDKPSSFVREYRPAGSNISLFSREDKRPAALPILKSAVFDFRMPRKIFQMELIRRLQHQATAEKHEIRKPHVLLRSTEKTVHSEFA